MTALAPSQSRSCAERLEARGEALRRVPVLSTTGALLVVYAIAYWRGGQVLPLDDAYITLHNAEVLFSGHDVSYGASALSGATSLFHLALTAALWPICGDATPAVVCLAGVTLYILGVARLARLCGLSVAAETLLILLAVSSGTVTFQLFNGLETSWALAGATWAVAIASRGVPDLRLAAVAGTLPFLRPELALVSLALLARQSKLRLGKPGFAAGVASDLVVAGLSAAPWLLWSAIETGALLPNTAAATAAFFSAPTGSLALVVASVLLALLKGVGPLPLMLPFARTSTLKVALLAAGLALLAIFSLRFPGLLSHNNGRYTMALLPFGLWALASFYEWRPKLFWALGGAIALPAPFWVASSFAIMSADQTQVRDAFAAVAWAEHQLPPGETMLVHDAGVAGLVSTRPLVDVVGLKTPGSLTAHQRWTLPSHGRERAKAIAEIAAAAHARYAMILQDEEGFWAGVGWDLQREGWRLETVRKPAADPGYAIFKLTPPG